jgi:hypothetical protein
MLEIMTKWHQTGDSHEILADYILCCFAVSLMQEVEKGSSDTLVVLFANGQQRPFTDANTSNRTSGCMTS